MSDINLDDLNVLPATGPLSESLGVTLAVTEDMLEGYAFLTDPLSASEVETVVREAHIEARFLSDNFSDPTEIAQKIGAGQPIKVVDRRYRSFPLPDLNFLDLSEAVANFWVRLHSRGPGEPAPRLPLISVPARYKLASRMKPEELEANLPILDIFGRVRPEKRRVAVIKLGKGVVEEEGDIYSTVAGSFDIRDSTLSVSETFKIEKIEDWPNREKISFIGGVEIGPEIMLNFDIEAVGDITVKGSVEGANLKSGATVVVSEGIQGNQIGRVEARQAIKARYANQAILFCENDIELKKGIYHSIVQSHGKLNVQMGHIVGGEAYGAYGVVAHVLGGEGNPRTVVAAGLCSTIPLSLDRASEELQAIVVELNELTEKTKPFLSHVTSLDRLSVADRIFVRDALKRLKELKTRARELSDWIKGRTPALYDRARIEVTGEIYPGVTVRVNNYVHEVQEIVRRVAIFPDPPNRKLRFEHLR